MADKRFLWARASSLEAVYELKSRNIQHPLIKDSGLKCVAEDCRKYCKAGDVCYLPTYNPGPANRVIAHAHCVDALVSEHRSASIKQAKIVEAKKLESRGILQPASPPAVTVPKRGGNGNPNYYKGFYFGIRYAFERAVPADSDNDPEWLRGFFEGTTFAADHERHS